MHFILKIWRQENQKDAGRFETYTVQNISPDASFLEMLDVLNNQLVLQDKDPVAFDRRHLRQLWTHDQRTRSWAGP